LPAAALLATLLGGCEPIRLATEGSHETVVSRRLIRTPGSGLQVSSRLEGSDLLIRAARGCDLVESQRVRVQEERVADEDLTEEVIVLAVSTLPLAGGVALLVDSPNVYAADRNSRFYNPAGEVAPIVGGVILTSVGGLLAMAATVQLVRIATAGEQRDSIVERRGRRLRGNVRCDGEPQPRSVPVVLGAGGRTVAELRTAADGRLKIDLLQVVPPAVAQRNPSVTVLVAGQHIAELDMAPIRQAQLERLDARQEGVWESIDVDRCRRDGSTDARACRAVSAYLEAFPDGAHADEARRLVERPPAAVMATDAPADDAVTDVVRRAKRAGQRAARRDCLAACRRECAGKRGCEGPCRVRACGTEPSRPRARKGRPR